MFDIAHVKPPKVNVLVDGTELAGWGGHVAWDDFKLVLKQNKTMNFKKSQLMAIKTGKKLALK